MSSTQNQVGANGATTAPQKKHRLQRFWQGATWRDRAVLAVGLIYLLSPIDIVPEAVLGPLGLADDGIILLVLLRTAFVVARRRGASPKKEQGGQ